MDNRVDLTILIPLYNEEESLRELNSWITRVVTEMGVSYECSLSMMVATDGSWQVIQELRERDPT